MGEPTVVGVSGLSGHGADCARSYEARGPYNRYSSTSNVSADRYEGESGKGRNEKRDEKRDGETWRGTAALFNSRTDEKSLARTTTATLTSFIPLRFVRSFNCSLCLYATAPLARAPLATINLLYIFRRTARFNRQLYLWANNFIYTFYNKIRRDTVQFISPFCNDWSLSSTKYL